MNVEHAARSGRPITATDEDHVAHVSVLLEEDHRFSCEELAEQVCISSSSVHHILREKLNKLKLAAKWILHLLTEEQLVNRTRIVLRISDDFDAKATDSCAESLRVTRPGLILLSSFFLNSSGSPHSGLVMDHRGQPRRSEVSHQSRQCTLSSSMCRAC